MTDHFRGGTITSGGNQARYYTYHLREGTSMSLHTSPQGREPSMSLYISQCTQGRELSISLYIPEVTLKSCVWLLCSEGSCSLNTESGFSLTFPLHTSCSNYGTPPNILTHTAPLVTFPPPPIHTHTHTPIPTPTHPYPHPHTAPFVATLILPHWVCSTWGWSWHTRETSDLQYHQEGPPRHCLVGRWLM